MRSDMGYFKTIRALTVLLVLVLYPAMVYAQSVVPFAYTPMPVNYFNIVADASHPAIDRNIAEMEGMRPYAAVQRGLEALEQSKALSYRQGIACASLMLGTNYNKLNKSNEAINCFETGLKYAGSLTNRELVGRLLNGMGGSYFYQNNYATALYYFYSAASEIEAGRLRTPEYQAAVYNNLGMIWNQFSNGPKAEFYLRKAKEICLVHNEFKLLARNYCNYGNYYLNIKNDTTNAQLSFLSALKIARDINEVYTSRLARANLANIALEQKKPEEAKRYLDELLAVADSLPLRMNVIVHCAYGSALILQHREDEALPYMLDALQKAGKLKGNEFVGTIYQALARIYMARNDAPKTHAYMLQVIEAYRQSFSKENRDKALELDSKYQTVVKDKQIATQQLEISRQQLNIQTSRFWIGAGVGGMLLFSALWMVSYRNFRHRRHIQENLFTAMQKEQQITQMQSRINGEEHVRQQIGNALHDGVASQLLNLKLRLQTMQAGHLVNGDGDEYAEILEQINETAQEVRSMAHQLTPDILLNEGLVTALDFYCRKVQTSTLIRVDFQAPGQIPRFPADFELLLYRMAQELIQNVVKHAHASEILVQLSCNEKILALTVEDNGIGLQEGKWREGAGLSSIRMRMKIYNGHMDIMNNDGTAIYLEFDTETLENKRSHAG